MLKYLFKFKHMLFLTISAIILSSLSYVFIAFQVKNIVDATNQKDLNKLYNTILVAIGILLLCFIFNYLKRLFIAKLSCKVGISLRSDLTDSIFKKDILELQETPHSENISTIVNDINILCRDYFDSILNIVSSAISFLLAFISILSINFYIGLSIILVSVLTFLIPNLFKNQLAMMKKSYSTQISVLTTKLKECFDGIQIIKNYNCEKEFLNNLTNEIYQAEHKKFKTYSLSGFIDELSWLLGYLMLFVTITLGSYFTIKGLLTIGSMLSITQLMNNIAGPIIMITIYNNQIKSTLEIRKKCLDNLNKSNLNKNCNKSINTMNTINLRNISIKSKEDKTILNNISYKFECGKKYLIVGKSGSGKTTLIKSLIKQFKLSNGDIFIDGVNYSDIPSSNLNELFTIMQQDTFVFDGTIQDNITLFKPYSYKEIENALIKSGLKTYIDKLPNGLQTKVDKNGQTLSGGEKQRLSLARALLKNTKILLLDEATSSLDNKLSYDIEKNLLDINGLTIISITHKLNSNLINNYDEILFIENGCIISNGSFNKLKDTCPQFNELYNAI